MKKKLLVLVLSAVMAVGMMSGCGAKSDTSDTKAKKAESSSAKEEETEEQTECELEDGTYTAEFKTDSGMFHVNEANDGKGTLTVKDGKMTIHVSLVSKKIVNLFEGTSEDAQKDGAELLEPTTDTVTYSDGATEEVFGCSLTCDTVLSGFAILELSADEPCATFALSVEDTFSAEEIISLSAVVSETTALTSPIFSDEVYSVPCFLQPDDKTNKPASESNNTLFIYIACLSEYPFKKSANNFCSFTLSLNSSGYSLKYLRSRLKVYCSVALSFLKTLSI